MTHPSSAVAEEGQASLEVVALVPVLLVVGLAILQLLAAGASAELGRHAAEVGAVAIIQGRDGASAARAALPGWSRRRLEIRVRGARVRVRVRPPAPLATLADLLATTAEANAGVRAR